MNEQALNHPDQQQRLAALEEAVAHYGRPQVSDNINNHIHTNYSFSPYSPTLALWKAWHAGLCTAGIMDHDTIAGAEEFIRAGEIIGMPTTVGVECRMDFSQTPLQGKRLNNTDQVSIAYVTLHGIPHTQFHEVEAFFAPIRKARNIRNEQMARRLSGLLAPYGITLDFTRDILPFSMAHQGGSVTERHLLFAAVIKLIERFGKGGLMLSCLEEEIGLRVDDRARAQLVDADNPYYEYDLLGLLKGEWLERFYIDAVEECPDIRAFIDLAARTGGIACYAYLGDVGVSATGDKRAQKFEDDYLELLFDTLRALSFQAVTYMPSRNTARQLDRLRDMCERYRFFQISGEDINSPRQSFVCPALQQAKFQNLRESTWALIAHERMSTADGQRAFFAPETIRQYPQLEARMTAYAKLGREIYGSAK